MSLFTRLLSFITFDFNQFIWGVYFVYFSLFLIFKDVMHVATTITYLIVGGSRRCGLFLILVCVLSCIPYNNMFWENHYELLDFYVH